MPNDNHYVDPDKLKEEILAFNESPEGTQIPESIGKAILDIAERLALLRKWNAYPFVDEMKLNAILRMTEAVRLKTYKTSKGNAFNYFTGVAENEFKQAINDERQQTFIKRNLACEKLIGAEGETKDRLESFIDANNTAAEAHKQWLVDKGRVNVGHGKPTRAPNGTRRGKTAKS